MIRFLAFLPVRPFAFPWKHGGKMASIDKNNSKKTEVLLSTNTTLSWPASYHPRLVTYPRNLRAKETPINIRNKKCFVVKIYRSQIWIAITPELLKTFLFFFRLELPTSFSRSARYEIKPLIIPGKRRSPWPLLSSAVFLLRFKQNQFRYFLTLFLVNLGDTSKHGHTVHNLIQHLFQNNFWHCHGKKTQPGYSSCKTAIRIPITVTCFL